MVLRLVVMLDVTNSDRISSFMEKEEKHNIDKLNELLRNFKKGSNKWVKSVQKSSILKGIKKP